MNRCTARCAACAVTPRRSNPVRWTWNAIGKAKGAWNLAPEANESEKGFLLNHLISEELPANRDGEHLSNSDPVTGQAAWYDVKVKIYKAEEGEPEQTSPQFTPVPVAPGTSKVRRAWQAFFAGKGEWK